jgi:hypothetical protein
MVGNQSIPLEIDCARRAFTIEMAAWGLRQYKYNLYSGKNITPKNLE